MITKGMFKTEKSSGYFSSCSTLKLPTGALGYITQSMTEQHNNYIIENTLCSSKHIMTGNSNRLDIKQRDYLAICRDSNMRLMPIQLVYIVIY